MKSFYYGLLLIFALAAGYERAEASHAMGADLQYECLGNNQYRVTLRFYRDCAGIAAPTSTSVAITAPGCYSGTINLNLTMNTTTNCPPGSTNGCEVSQLCPSQINQSSCNWTGSGTAPYPGVEVYEYSGIVTLPTACSNWRIRFSECCRNNQINNVLNPSGNDLSIEAIVNNTINPATGQSYCNNSSDFSALPVPFVCANSNVTYNHGAVDVDGDSLVYNLITPLGNGFNPMTFAGGWNVNNPVRTNPPNSFGFSNSTGQMTFKPGFQEVDVLAIRVDEYRNGVLVGSTMRDIQVVVLNCAIAIPDQDPITNVQNGNQVDSVSVQVCPGTPLQFDVLCTDPANHNLTLTSNITSVPSAIPGATFQQIGTGDSVVGRVTWTPLPSDTGCHTFLIYAENDDCPINGVYVRPYTICVFTKVQLLSASPTFCGTPVQLTATGGTNFNWSPSTGPNAVSNPNSLKPTVSPVSDQWYYFSSDCGTDSVFVQSDPPFLYDAGPGGNICQNGQLQLNATTDNLYTPYTFKWVPSTGLVDPILGNPTDSISNPVAEPLATTKYLLYITGANGCTNVDSLTVTVGGTGPNIVAKAQPANVCPGDTVSLSIVTNPQSCGITPTPCSGNRIIGQIGTGTGQTPTGSPTQYPTIYGHYSNSARHQFLYLSNELLAQMGSGGQIDTIWFNVSQVNTQNDTMKNFEIKMGCTQVGSLSSWQPNLSTVFTPKNVPVGNTPGWRAHKLDFPYDWDGTSNLVVDICFNNPTSSTLNAKMQMTPTAFNSVYFSKGNNSQCGTTGTPQTSVNRPNTRFSMCVTDVSGLPIAWDPASGPNAPVPNNIQNPKATPQTPVIYYVDVTAQNGCVSSDFIYVNVDTSLRFFAYPADTFFCSPANVQLTTQTIGSPLPGQQFSYQFRNITTNTVVYNGPNNNFTLNATATADYVVTLSGGACTLRDTIRVVVGNNIPVNFVVDSIDCFNSNNGKIKAVPTGGSSPITYTWNTGATIDSIQNLTPGQYSVTIQDAIGCTGSANYNLTQPTQLTVSAAAQNILCFGSNNGTISLTAGGGTPGYTYQWSPSQLPQASVSGLAPGTFNATVYDANNCSATATATITQPAQLTATVVAFDATSFGGNEGWAYATATGGVSPYTFNWNNNSTNDTITNLYAGTYTVTICDANGCCLQDTAIVNDPPPILLTFVTANNLCFGDCNGSASVSASGGIEPYTFVWSNGVADSSISNLCAGTYTVTATDSAGITVQGNVNITAPTAISVVLDTTDITCFGANNASVEAIASGGTGGYNYTWSNGSSQNPLNNLGPNNYIVTVTDANSCTANASWTAIEPPLLAVTVANTTNVTCFGGNNGSAIASATGGTPAYTYNWSSVGSTGNTATATGFTANPAHSVTVTDTRSCTATASFAITEPTALIVAITSVTDATCFAAANGAIDITAGGATPGYTFLWSNNSVTEDLAGIAAGYYTVTVTDAQYCTATAAATVAEPTAITLSFAKTDPLCAGDNNGTTTVTATGGTPGYTYAWDAAPGFNNATLANLPAGIYTVTVSDVNNCTIQSSVTLNDPPSLSAAFINKNEISCANATDGSVEVQVNGGTPPYNYSWTNGSTTAQLNNLAPGSYTVTVADANGCDTVMSILFVAPPPISFFSLVIDSASCPGYEDGSIQVTAVGGTPGVVVPYEFSLNGSPYQASPFFNNLGAGIYNLQVRDSEGCSEDTTLFVLEPAEADLLVLPDDSLINLGSSITLVSNVSNYTSSQINFYSWEPFTGLTCADCAVTVATPYNHTDYTLTVNYLNNCSVSGTVRVFVNDGVAFFVPNSFSPNGDGNNDVLQVYGTGLSTVNLTIFNRWGEKIFDSDNQWKGWDGTYKGVLQNPGVYTYRVVATYLNGEQREKSGTVTIIR